MKNRIGIVGGGQLARMLTFEAKKLGFYVTILDNTPYSPAGQVADQQIVAELTSEKAMEQLAEQSDYITFDWEHADPDLLEQFEKQGITVNPSPKTLRMIKDKLVQKEFLQDHNIAVAPFMKIQDNEDFFEAGERFGYPFLLKARVGGYDGKGNIVIKNKKAVEEYCNRPLHKETWYVEQHVDFAKEVSIIAARDMKDTIKLYPVAENIHKNHILHTTIIPAQISKKVERKAKKLALQTMAHLQGAGVFGIEMFITKKGEVLINEIAPRVHNSGHFTIEACVTSQFAQHVRAITGLPLGKTDMIVPAVVMINILGIRNGQVNITGLEKALDIPGVFVHFYGKAESKIERKMGHITAIGNSKEEAMRKATKARKYITI